MVSVPQISLIGATGPSENSAINFFNALPQQQTTLAGEVSDGLTRAAAIQQAQAQAEIAASSKAKTDELRDLQIEAAKDKQVKQEELEIFNSLYDQSDASGKTELLMNKGVELLSAQEVRLRASVIATDPTAEPADITRVVGLSSKKSTQEYFADASNYQITEADTFRSLTIDPNSVKDWNLLRETNSKGTSEPVVTVNYTNGESQRLVGESSIGKENLQKLQKIQEFRKSFEQVEQNANLSNKVVKSQKELDEAYRNAQNLLNEAKSGNISPSDREAKSIEANKAMTDLRQSIEDFKAAGNTYARTFASEKVAEQKLLDIGSGAADPAPVESDLPVVMVTVPTAAIRTGPGSNHGFKMEAFQNSRFVIEKKEGDWYRIIDSTGSRGYIHSSVVTPAEPEAVTETVNVMTYDKYKQGLPDATMTDYLKWASAYQASKAPPKETLK